MTLAKYGEFIRLLLGSSFADVGKYLDFCVEWRGHSRAQISPTSSHGGTSRECSCLSRPSYLQEDS
jgi:hypothetical protein